MRLFALLAGLLAASPALARPTSGDMAIVSGRTMGVDEAAIAAGVGWPGIWAEYLVAPSSTFNVGFRATVIYGTPIMGFGTGVGAEAMVPLRFHLHGEGMLDVTLQLEPSLFAGDATLGGEEGAFSAMFAFGGRLEATLLAGARVSEVVTLTLGLGGGAGVSFPEGTDASGSGTLLLVASIEALMARDTMLFAEIRGGYGLARGSLFDGHEIVRASLGLSYLF